MLIFIKAVLKETQIKITSSLIQQLMLNHPLIMVKVVLKINRQ